MDAIILFYLHRGVWKKKSHWNIRIFLFRFTICIFCFGLLICIIWIVKSYYEMKNTKKCGIRTDSWFTQTDTKNHTYSRRILSKKTYFHWVPLFLTVSAWIKSQNHKFTFYVDVGKCKGRVSEQIATNVIFFPSYIQLCLAFSFALRYKVS